MLLPFNLVLSRAVINGIFKPNAPTIQPLSVPFIFSRMAISLIPLAVLIIYAQTSKTINKSFLLELLDLGAYSQHLIFFIIYKWVQRARVFVPDQHFLPTVMIHYSL
jgi:hypothetical protein